MGRGSPSRDSDRTTAGGAGRRGNVRAGDAGFGGGAMNRRLMLLTGLTGLGGLLGLVGCVGQQIRSQSGEEERDGRDYEVRTIADVTAAAVADSVPCGGVGLVVGLNGTGGPAPPGAYRAMLEKELKTRKIDNIKSLI